jgi:hypothetical protein
VRGQRNAADQVENFVPLRRTAVNVMIYRDFEHVEGVQVCARPCRDRASIANPDGGAPFPARLSHFHLMLSNARRQRYLGAY